MTAGVNNILDGEGYILNGEYHRGKAPLGVTESSQFKAWSHDSQRREHRADLVQPYTRDGKPNPEFINLYPEESKGYGFIKE